jgi:hypothetical protein
MITSLRSLESFTVVKYFRANLSEQQGFRVFFICLPQHGQFGKYARIGNRVISVHFDPFSL